MKKYLLVLIFLTLVFYIYTRLTDSCPAFVNSILPEKTEIRIEEKKITNAMIDYEKNKDTSYTNVLIPHQTDTHSHVSHGQTMKILDDQTIMSTSFTQSELDFIGKENKKIYDSLQSTAENEPIFGTQLTYGQINSALDNNLIITDLMQPPHEDELLFGTQLTYKQISTASQYNYTVSESMKSDYRASAYKFSSE
jgi:hypothetical protein